MKVLIVGASGFLGGRIAARLVAAGHRVVRGQRRAPCDASPADWIETDYTRPRDAAGWQALLSGFDAVVNAVGILQQRGRQTFDALHVEGPRALFAGCARAGVPRVVQISALGADDAADTPYHLTKKAADDALLGLPIASAVVVQPSLVFGPGGASAGLFLGLASLPVLPLPAGGRQPVQPIHVDDVAEAVCRLVTADPPPASGRIALVGPEPLTLAGYLQALRASMGLPKAPTLAIPAALVGLTARLAGRLLPASPLDADTWRMLQRGNVAPVEATRSLLGRAPRSPDRFVAADRAADALRAARLGWLLAVLRWMMAAVWLGTAAVSAGLYPVADSYVLLARAGVPPVWAPWALAGAAALDAAFGIACLLPRRPRVLWTAQAALILGYTAVITVRLPEFWLHPYGPLLKNLPILAVLLVLHQLDGPGAGAGVDAGPRA